MFKVVVLVLAGLLGGKKYTLPLAFCNHWLTSYFALKLIATAFAPVSRSVATSSKVSMSFADELGAQAPLGFWDPLGLLKTADQARFERLRSVEVKHGRISMLAILGHLVTTAGNRLPGDIAYGVPFTSVKAGLAAFENIPAAGTLQLVSPFHSI